jgi:hypothetical protein
MAFDMMSIYTGNHISDNNEEIDDDEEIDKDALEKMLKDLNNVIDATETPHNEQIRKQEINNFINPLSKFPENRLLNFKYFKGNMYTYITNNPELTEVPLPNVLTITKTYTFKHKHTDKIMKKYIDDCYTSIITDNEKNYTSCSMNQEGKCIAIQITICEEICILTLAYNNQEVYSNYYNKTEFEKAFYGTTFFTKYKYFLVIIGNIKNITI